MTDDTTPFEPDAGDGDSAATSEGATAEGGTTATTTDPPPPLPPDQRPQPPRRLRRAPDGPLGGVATGLANYFDVSPLVFQAGFVISIAVSGFGLLAYIACWFLIPAAADPETRPVTITSDTTRVVLGVLFAVLAASTSFTIGPNTFEITVIPLLLVAAGFYLLSQRDTDATGPAPTSQPVEPTSTPTSTSAATASTATASYWAAVDQPTTFAPADPPEPPGPPVTSVTLAVAAVAVGLLLTIGQFGPSVPAVAVLGTALAVIGGGLVYGAFRGRPRGLVPLGILLALGLAIAPAFDALADGGTGTKEFSPVDEAEVLDVYDLGAGEMQLDLRRVEFTEDRAIEVNIGAGYAEIWLPDDVDVQVDAQASAGYIDLFGRETAGLFADASGMRAGEPGSPTISIDAEVTFGYVEVRRG